MFQRLVSKYREIVSFFVIGDRENTLILRLICLNNTLKNYKSFVIGELIKSNTIKESEVLAYTRKEDGKNGYQISITIKNNIIKKENIIVILKSNDKNILLTTKDKFDSVSLMFDSIVSKNLAYTTMIPPFIYEKEEYIKNIQMPAKKNESNFSSEAIELIKNDVDNITKNILVHHNTNNKNTRNKNANSHIDYENKENAKDLEKKVITSDIAVSLDAQDKEDYSILRLKTVEKISNKAIKQSNSCKNIENQIFQKDTIINPSFQLSFEESIKYTFSSLLISKLNTDVKYLVKDVSETPSLNKNKIEKVYKIAQSELENSPEISFKLLYNILKALNIQVSEDFILVGYSKGKFTLHGELLFMIPVEKSFSNEYIKNKNLTYTNSKVNSELKYLTCYYTY